MTAVATEPDAGVTPADERLARQSLWQRVFQRPEFGSIVGLVVVFTLFYWQAGPFRGWLGTVNYLDVASLLGISAVAVALLMIGGEFDLSAGVMVGFSGMVTALLSVESGWNIWLALAASLAACLVIGALNGLMVVRSGLPSFIITLGTFFILRGFNLWLTQRVTDLTNVTDVDQTSGYEAAERLFSGTLFSLGGADFEAKLLWFLGVAVVAQWLLTKSRAGNWIFAAGGNRDAARSVGVPAGRTKIALFMGTAFAGWLVGTIVVIETTRSNVIEGVGGEFEFIIAAVLGGCLLTGGYGSAVGAAIGALIFGMTRQGIVQAGWDNNLFFLFLGVILLAATFSNNLIRKKAEASGRRRE
jgi:simple sugar transport system permease protein